MVRDLALGLPHRMVAERFGRSHQAVKQFASRNADEINEAKRYECEDITLWGVQKHEQLALIRDQIIEIRDRILLGDLTASQEVRWRSIIPLPDAAP